MPEKFQALETPRQTDTSYVFLPPILEIEPSDDHSVLPYVRTDLIKQNFNMMHDLDRSVLSDDEVNEWVDLCLLIYNVYSHFGFTLERMKGSKPIHDTLQDELAPYFDVFHQSTRSVQDVERLVTNIFEGVEGNFLFLSSTHASLYPQLKAAKQISHAKVGLVLLDRHTDIFDSTQARATRALFPDVMVGKENVIHMSLQEGLVDAVSCIGVSAIEREYITQGYPEGDDLAGTHERYLQHQDRLFLTREAEYMRGETTQFDAYAMQVAEHIEAFRQKGIERVLFSVDSDVLRFPYTAVDYSNIGFLLNLGIQDFSKIERKASKTVSKTEMPRFIYKQMLEAVYAPHYPIHAVRKVQKGPVKGVNGYGLNLSDVDYAIRAFGSAFPVGVPLPHGGVFAGDITELVGFDLGGHTAKTTRIIAETIGSVLPQQ